MPTTSKTDPALLRPRSVLFAPGNRADLIAKLPRSRPDAVVIDLEDAVPAQAKAEARPIALAAAQALQQQAPSLPIFLRVNALHSPYFVGDIAALSPELAESLAGLVIPKLESAADVEQVAETLAARELKLPLMAGIETGAGVWNAREIMQRSESDSPVAWAYFGAEDYTADLGGTRTPGNLEVLYARSQVALAARLGGVAALDIVVTALNDEAAFREDAAQGRALGYAGKLCIHPAQVALANQIFGVSDAEMTRARQLLAAADEAAKAGRGAISFEGQMVDEPMLVRARAVVSAAQGAQNE